MLDLVWMKAQLREYIAKTILKGEVELTDETRLFSTGLLSSLMHLKLINFIEKKFNASLPFPDLKVEEFDSVEKICECLCRQNQ